MLVWLMQIIDIIRRYFLILWPSVFNCTAGQYGVMPFMSYKKEAFILFSYFFFMSYLFLLTG